jgi:hypothetical protein
VWISNNPAPPVVDPGVIADPGLPRYHQPRSTLPVARVRAAVKEFCRTGTGHRPSRVDWAMGHLGGRRLDTPVREEHIARCADPWCEVLEPGHLAHGG